jgi:alkaline phosphatase
MKIGHYYTAMGYTETTVEDLVEPLEGMRITSTGLARKIGADLSVENIIAQVDEWWGLEITEDDVNEILDLNTSVGLSYALSRVISKNYTVIGWTTHGHNGETVPLWVFGADAPAGIIDNTDLAKIAAKSMWVNLDKLTKRLFVDLSTVTSDFEIDKADPENPVLKVAGAELPISKDYMVKNGRTIPLRGLTVYAPANEKVYISKMALRILGLL